MDVERPLFSFGIRGSKMPAQSASAGANRKYLMKRNSNGFTVAELLVATAITMLIMAGVVSIFLAQQRLYQQERQTSDMSQTIRLATDFITSDLRMAGYGVPVPDGEFPLWINWVAGVSNAISVTQGASAADPDRISITAAFEEPLNNLSQAVPVGDTVIKVPAGTSGMFNTTTRKVIFLGNTELARIVSIAGANLTISTDPTTNGVGLAFAYPAGAPIELVEVVTYYCNNTVTNFPYRPYLGKDRHASAVSNEVQRLIAVGVENLQATLLSNAVAFVLTGRTDEPDRHYTHPTAGDHYRRKTLNCEVTTRNAR